MHRPTGIVGGVDVERVDPDAGRSAHHQDVRRGGEQVRTAVEPTLVRIQKALDRLAAKKSKWKDLAQKYFVESKTAGDPAFKASLLVSAAEIEAELARIGHTLQPLEIVVVNTSAGVKYGRQDYVTSGCGMGYEATMYLLERGVRLTGTDAWSWDAPFSYTAKKVAETGNKALIWEGHKAGRDIGYCHLEKLHNLEALPPHGFTVSCFPHKIRGASAGARPWSPSRVRAPTTIRCPRASCGSRCTAPARPMIGHTSTTRSPSVM